MLNSGEKNKLVFVEFKLMTAIEKSFQPGDKQIFDDF